MKRLNVHILYEYGVNMRPHASASLRLLRPFSHPLVRKEVDATFGFDLTDSTPDLVLVDRLWRPNIQPHMVDELVEKVHRKGAKLIYWFDDNFLGLEGRKSIPPGFVESFRRFLEVSDGFVVSTLVLFKEFSNLRKTVFLPSALDERIIVRKLEKKPDPRKITIGYMGSSTHDEDLRMVLPALREVNALHPGRLRFQFVGALNEEKLKSWKDLAQMPVEILQPSPEESEYQLFMLWFTGTVRWDFAIAPLMDNWFNRFKSDIKFLDYTAAAAPGIFSSVAPYAATIETRKTGLVIENSRENWVSAMEELIENNTLRSALIHNAVDHLYEERILSKCAGNWVKALHEVME